MTSSASPSRFLCERHSTLGLCPADHHLPETPGVPVTEERPRHPDLAGLPDPRPLEDDQIGDGPAGSSARTCSTMAFSTRSSGNRPNYLQDAGHHRPSLHPADYPRPEPLALPVTELHLARSDPARGPDSLPPGEALLPGMMALPALPTQDESHDDYVNGDSEEFPEKSTMVSSHEQRSGCKTESWRTSPHPLGAHDPYPDARTAAEEHRGHPARRRLPAGIFLANVSERSQPTTAHLPGTSIREGAQAPDLHAVPATGVHRGHPDQSCLPGASLPETELQDDEDSKLRSGWLLEQVLLMPSKRPGQMGNSHRIGSGTLWTWVEICAALECEFVTWPPIRNRIIRAWEIVCAHYFTCDLPMPHGLNAHEFARLAEESLRQQWHRAHLDGRQLVAPSDRSRQARSRRIKEPGPNAVPTSPRSTCYRRDP